MSSADVFDSADFWNALCRPVPVFYEHKLDAGDCRPAHFNVGIAPG